MPDLYLILDASISISRSRRSGRGEGEDRFDEREEAYQKRVRAGYKEFAKRLGKRALVLDAAMPQRDVNETIMQAIEKLA